MNHSAAWSQTCFVHGQKWCVILFQATLSLKSQTEVATSSLDLANEIENIVKQRAVRAPVFLSILLGNSSLAPFIFSFVTVHGGYQLSYIFWQLKFCFV